MDLTIEQWERLQMMVSNPSREGIKTIVIEKDDVNKEWSISAYADKDIVAPIYDEVIRSPELGEKDDR